ncbi:unnamed protein product [Urochloa humidicola]
MLPNRAVPRSANPPEPAWTSASRCRCRSGQAGSGSWYQWKSTGGRGNSDSRRSRRQSLNGGSGGEGALGVTVGVGRRRRSRGDRCRVAEDHDLPTDGGAAIAPAVVPPPLLSLHLQWAWAYRSTALGMRAAGGALAVYSTAGRLVELWPRVGCGLRGSDVGASPSLRRAGKHLWLWTAWEVETLLAFRRPSCWHRAGRGAKRRSEGPSVDTERRTTRREGMILPGDDDTTKLVAAL